MEKNFSCDIDSTLIKYDYDNLINGQYCWSVNNVVLKAVKKLIKEGYSFYIITTRYEKNDNKKLFPSVEEIIKKIGIVPKQIIFTNGESKKIFIKKIHSLFHFDDDAEEFDETNFECKFILIK